MIAAPVKKTKETLAAPVTNLTQVTDAMHAMLVKRVDELVGPELALRRRS